MYYEANSARIDDKVQNGQLVKQLSDEKNKIEKNYGTLMNDVKKFMEETKKKMVEQNFNKIKFGENDKYFMLH
jgi:hypothetical protein